MRTGKLKGTTKILIPWFDSEGQRQYSMITLTGTIYASKMYAGIKDFVKQNFNVEVDKDWLAHVPLISNSEDPEIKVTDEERDQLIEEFIQRMELKDDEIENEPTGGSESEDADKASEPLRTLPDQSSTG